jgi:hypothetical protein
VADHDLYERQPASQRRRPTLASIAPPTGSTTPAADHGRGERPSAAGRHGHNARNSPAATTTFLVTTHFARGLAACRDYRNEPDPAWWWCPECGGQLGGSPTLKVVPDSHHRNSGSPSREERSHDPHWRVTRLADRGESEVRTNTGSPKTCIRGSGGRRERRVRGSRHRTGLGLPAHY